MAIRLLHRLLALGRAAAHGRRQRLLAATRPTIAPLACAALGDVARSKPALVAANALLRHQLAIRRRTVKRPRCTPADRALLVLLASRIRAWRSALLIVQPATLLRWHRQLLRWSWRRRSRAAAPAHRPPLAPETIALIPELAGSVSGANSSRSVSASPRRPSSGTGATPARRDVRGRPGRRSCATTLTRSGPATSCPSPTASSARSSPASSSRAARAA